jgi:hypothetical protein
METVCELSTSQRILYRLLTPLILGGCLASALGYTVFNLIRDSDVPEWMHTFAFRGALAVLMLGFGWWLSSQVGKSHAWVKMDNESLHMKSLWTGRVRRRAIVDIKEVKEFTYGGRVVGCSISFDDGFQLHLEGRMGPGLLALISHPSFRSKVTPP